MMYKKTICLTAVILGLVMTGCSEYHADIPKFTTSSDRDTGFVPKSNNTIKADQNKPSAIKELESEINEGILNVKEKSEQFTHDRMNKESP